MSRHLFPTPRLPSSARRIAAAAVLFAAASLAPTAPAQPCFGLDNMNGGCCQVVTPNLPAFPAFGIPGMGVCWKNCQPNVQNTLKIAVQTPVQTACTQWTAALDVFDGSSGLPMLNGKLVLDYTRTWEEVDPSGVSHQVWRFAAKADLAPVLVGIVPPCPTPSCLPPFGGEPTAFFYGYVDYAAPCTGSGGLTEHAMVLYHACDFFIHRPGLSSAPGVYHPAESYAIVAPVSATQPFVLNNTAPSGGPLLGDGVRTTPPVLPPLCLATDPIVQGQMSPLGGVCPCPPSGNPPQHQLRKFAGQTSCPDATGLPGGFQSLNIGFPNLLPWFHLTTTNIGRWTSNTAYPGKEAAFVEEGLFLQNDGCSPHHVSIQYGGSTRFGWSILHPVLLSGCTDLASNYHVQVGGPYPFPIMGRVSPTDKLIYVFTP